MAPVVILAIWGWTYVRSLLSTLESPGIPIELKYTTASGKKARFYAASYAIDFDKGYVRLGGLRVEDPSGGVVARMDHLEARGLNALYGMDQVVKVRGSKLSGRLVRLKTGRFELEDLLPEQKDQIDNKIPFEVVIDGVDFDLIDHAGTPWRERFTTPRVLVAGVGKNWIAKVRGTVTHMGTVDTRVQYLKDFGISALASTERLELGKLANHLTTTPETKAVPDRQRASVGTLTIHGPFRVFLPEKKTAQVETTLVAEATDVRYGQYFFDSGSFKGLITGAGAVGKGEARQGANRVSINGSMRWDKTQRFAGTVVASSPGLSSLPSWARAQIPKGALYENGSYDGWVAYYPDTGLRLSGDVSADRIVYNGETIRNPNADLRYVGGRAVVRLESGFFRGERASGVVAYEPNSGKLFGGIDTAKVDLERLAAQFGFSGLSGTAVVSATMGGTVARPTATFNASGSGKLRYRQWVIPATAFQASGSYDNGALTLTRAYIDSPAGLVTASGSIGKAGAVGIDVTVRSMRPRILHRDFGGSGNLQARITGTLQNPVVKGRVEGYALRYKEERLPVLTAMFTATPKDVRFRDLQAVRGSAVIQGSGRYVFATRQIEGDLKAQGLQVADVLGPEFVGAVEVPSLELGGTLDKPIVTAQLRGTNLLARGIKIEMLSGRAETVNGVIRLRDSFAKLAGGTITADGSYDPVKATGTLTLNATDVDLEKLMPEFSAYVSVAGEVSGQATLTLAKGELKSASGQGRLKDVVVNGTAVGSGPWTVGSNNGLLTGTLEIGQLDRFLTLQDFSLNPKTKAIGGKLDVFNISVKDLVAISQRYMPETMDFELRRAIAELSGTVSMASSFGGTLDDPNVAVPTLSVTNIKFREAVFESLIANFSIENDVWTINSFDLLGDPTPTAGVGRKGQARYALSGTVEEHGGTNVSGAFTNLSIQEFSAFVPWFTGKSGEADFFFAVTGPTANPQVRASLEAKGMLAEMDKQLMAEVAAASAAGEIPEDQIKRFYDKTLRVNLFSIEATGGEEGGIDIEGNYFWKGFQGAITAHAPFEYPFVIPRNRPAKGTITLAERDLKEIAALVEGLDEKRTVGTVKGQLQASGTPSNLTLDGEVLMNAESFAMDGVDDVIKNMKARLALEPKRIAGSFEGESSRGGDLHAQVESPVADLRDFANAVQAGVLTTLLDNPISGSAKLGKLAVSRTLEGGTDISAVTQADIQVSGTIASPLIKGDGVISSAVLRLGGFATPAGIQDPPIINPRFDINVTLGNPAKVKNSLADMALVGTGSLKGSLQYPQVSAALIVDSGSINLPGNKVRLEQGGTVDIGFNATPLDVFSSVNVDMEGKTAVTAPRFGDILERYDVYLGIRGDLLKEGGLVLTATSDPPDLSQDRILALLGQADLISGIGQSFGQGGLGNSTEQKLRSALIGFSLPMLLDPITSGIAQSLSLDYLSLEYNAYDQASLVFSKPLGNGFSLQGRRQITPPPPGFLQQYDIRLVYRPRRLPGILNRFSFSFGADELRPWKIAVEYGTRFMWK
ncbi:MAG: translocation/assembly module TamB domain-containing protein [Fimbriimonas sp.]